MALPASAATVIDESKLPPPAQVRIEFARDIKPIFEQSCARCHGIERPKGHFRLGNREDALKGGDNGVDILPGESAKSPLIHYVAGLVDEMEMPPKGKGQPLTAAQIGLLRAWIDQGVTWESTPSGPHYAFSFTPTVRWVTVQGNERKFREHRWVRDGWNGGLEHFEVQQRLGKDSQATVVGQALLDEYKVAVTLEKRDVGFTRFGFEQFRKYYDDNGGYYPGFTPSLFSLNRDLHLDQGRGWVDFGLTLPDWPRMTVGYEYQYREGEKSTLQWGPVTQGADTKNIFPAAKSIDEHVHVIKFDLDHEIGGYRFEDTFRGEFFELQTVRPNPVAYTVGASAPSKIEAVAERSEYFNGANAVRVEKQLAAWWLGSVGYLYSHLDSDEKFNLDTLFPLGAPGFANQWQTHELVLERETHAFNATTMLGSWQGLTLSAGVLSEWTRQDGFGRANLDLVFPPAFNLTNFIPVGLDSSYDRALIEESLALRFTALRFTTIFADARLQQDRVGEDEQQTGGPYEFLRKTDADGELRDVRAGFNSSPWRHVSFGGHYRRYEKETEFDDSMDQSVNGGQGYPAFIRWRDVTTDEVEGKLTLHPVGWLKTTLSYKRVNSDYETETDTISAGTPGDISSGLRLQSATYDADIYGFNATFTPWQRLYLSGTFSYQDTRMAAFDNESPAVVPYRGDLFGVIASVAFAATTNIDLTAAYSCSWADYSQNNLGAGLPLGIHYRQHGVVTGVLRRWTRNISTRLQYGFYAYDEPSSGGANDYTAHAVLASMVFRLP